MPTNYSTVTNGTRANLKANFDETQTKVNPCMDSVDEVRNRFSAYSGSFAIVSLENLRLRLDTDGSATSALVVETSNGDSLFRVSEDSSAKFFGSLAVAGTTTFTGAPTFSSLTASLPVFTNGSKTLTSNAMTGTGSVVMSASPTGTGTWALPIVNIAGRTALSDSLIGISARWTGNIAAVNGSLSGTLGVTGVQTNSEAIVFNGNGTGGTARIYKSAADGVVARGVAGSANDFALINVVGNIIFANPTGTGNLTVGYASGGVTIPGTATTTGVHTFTAAPVFSTLANRIMVAGPAGALTGNSNLAYDGSTITWGAGNTIIGATGAVSLSSTLAVTGNISTNGLVSIGAVPVPNTNTALDVRSANLAGATQYGILSQVVCAGATASGIGLATGLNSTGSYTMATGYGLNIYAPTLGATTVTNLIGLNIENQSGGGTNYAIKTGTAGLIQLGSLTASSAVATDASKNLVSVTNTGTGNNVLSASPTLTGTIAAASQTLSGSLTIGTTATTTGVHTFTAAPVFSSVSASQILSVDASKNLTSTATTGTGSVMLAASPTTTGTLTAAAITASGLTTATGGLSLGASFVDKTTSLTSNTTLTSAHSTVFCVTTGGGFTVTLPTAVGNTGLTYSIYKNDASTNPLTITTTLTQAIGAFSQMALNGNQAISWLIVVSNGTGWTIKDFNDCGSFTYTEATGVASTPTGTASYQLSIGGCSMSFTPVAGTGNTTVFTVTGMPGSLRPTVAKLCRVVVTDNGVAIGAMASIGTSGTITFSTEVASGTPVTFNSAGFTASGTKQLGNGSSDMTVSYNPWF